MSPPPRTRAFVGVGANLGDARATVRAALSRLAELGPLRVSALYRTAPLDASGPDFINAVAEVHTALAAQALLGELQALEAAFGRERPYRHAPRTLDLDLLLHGSACLATPRLTLPHPRLHQRAFVLHPLLELAPDLLLPGLGRLADHLAATAGQAIERLPE
ncbi:MAG: 2-amino-4-hydroxy-6-hydroxymethyldihydropteridine diphosphokinase [Burkholderiales bacterium]|nr:2-amino-4-hydroxy-6-hydroxymethyldihydropteridine diphosphokinase [Burkholderiales bacterium]